MVNSSDARKLPSPPNGCSSRRKERIRELANRLAEDRDSWIQRNEYYHAHDLEYMQFLVPPGKRILDLGCGNGSLLSALQPSRGVGVDFSTRAIELAKEHHPDLEFHLGDIEADAIARDIAGPFDVIILSDTIGCVEDVQATLASLHRWCLPTSRVIISYWSKLWAPILKAAEAIGDHMPSVEENWLGPRDIVSVLALADFQAIHIEWRQLIPKRAAGVGDIVNRYVATLPGIRRLGLRYYVVARPANAITTAPSISVVIPCRNEAGNIESAAVRVPPMADNMELIFVEGHSTDGTLDEISRVAKANPDSRIRVITQKGEGKGDAVRQGFEIANNDVLMILDADLSTLPEDLPKFYNAIRTGKADLAIGTRMVYPMEDQAMRFLNIAGNKAFSLLFSWLLGQRITDTLCGTKVLTRSTYEEIASNRKYFGDFDPFGDFDLLFGAAKQHHKIVEVPVRYHARRYGVTQISRFKHGWLLLRMVIVGYKKFKAF